MKPRVKRVKVDGFDISFIPATNHGVADWPDDVTAVVVALRGCQEGLGGLFPNGTAGMGYSHADHQAFAARRARLNRIADELEAGTLHIVEQPTNERASNAD